MKGFAGGKVCAEIAIARKKKEPPIHNLRMNAIL
jgi:hypothetical protein